VRRPLSLHAVRPEDVDWDRMDAFVDRTVFQTREWLSFIAATQQAKLVIAAVRDGTTTLGYFTGLIMRKFGVRILGSPFPGWTTDYMGFNLESGISRRAAVEALVPFAFSELGCIHLELRDRSLTLEDVDGLGFEYTPKTVYEVDLQRTEDEIFAGMTSACRRCIRKAEKVGVEVEEATDGSFAHDYYEQLRDVYAKQSLTPSYTEERVRQLIRFLQPTGRLLLLRARNAEGKPIATGIFPAMNGTMYFWGGASWREQQILRPNEYLMWHAMRYWRERGIGVCDLGGGADYKRKYGVREVPVHFFRKSRYRMASRVRNAAKKAFRLRQAAAGRSRSLVGGAAKS
jgi:CelD/BcsL family acetyltransferase involved in cellulose biosynthesis